MTFFETKAYRVKFPSGDGKAELAGIIDHPIDTADVGQLQRRPVAVFSHCFTCNKDLKATVRISRALARSGVQVLRFDMTGLGGSSGDFSDTNFTTNLADLAAAIRFADQELGPVNALIGHSFGGIAALVTASKAAANQVTTNTASESPECPLTELGFVATLAAPSDTQHLATLLSRLSPEIEASGQGKVTIGGIQWTIRQQMLDDFRAHDVTKQLPGIRCPVLLMHSPVDETVGFDHALRLMSLIQHSPARDTLNESANGSGGFSGSVHPVSLASLAGADHLLVQNPADLAFVSSLLVSWCERYATLGSVRSGSKSAVR